MNNRIASENRLQSAVPCVREEPLVGERSESPSTSTASLWDQMLECSNLQRALKQVRQNKGAPGIDGMSVDDLPDFLRQNWPAIRSKLEAGQYCPRLVKRVRIPKADGRERLLGIPTVLDRFIQQAIAQVVSAQWDPHFHPRSYGFRPGKSAHQAVKRLQLLGWKAYLGISEVPSPLREIDKWLRRRLRCYLWKQRGRSGYRLSSDTHHCALRRHLLLRTRGRDFRVC